MNNLVLSSWAYTGPVLSCILRANFDDPVDTAQDIITLNMTLFYDPGGEMWKQWLAEHNNTDYNKVAETMIIAKNWEEWDKLVEQGILDNRTHVYFSSYVGPWEMSLGQQLVKPGLSPLTKNESQRMGGLVQIPGET